MSDSTPDSDLVPVYIMGKRYMVPKSLTIMKALEYAGYKLIRGCGCRGGFCGACATVYRLPGEYKVRTGLACQTIVEPNMYLAELPFFPAVKKTYDIEKIEPKSEDILAIYPEVARCVSCNTCTKSCPQDLEVMDAINLILRNELEKAAHLTFDCIMCGLCAARCPAEIVHYNVFHLVQRLYGSKIAPRSQQLRKRINDIKKGKFKKDVERLMNASEDELKELYRNRDIEPT